MGTKIRFVGSFLLRGRGSGLFSRQFFRKFNLPKTVRTETKVCSAKYTERKQTSSLKTQMLPAHGSGHRVVIVTIR